MIQRNRAGSKEDQSERYRCRCKSRFISRMIWRSQHSVVQMHFPNDDAEIDADCNGRTAGEESRQQQHSSEELHECPDVAHPGRQAVHRVGEMPEASEYLVISVYDHDDTKNNARDEKSQRL